MTQSILYGNGINRLTKGMPSWDKLIEDLFKVELEGTAPNPLNYEALLMKKHYRQQPQALLGCDGQPILINDGNSLNVLGDLTEKVLQKRIAKKLSGFHTNQIYDSISKLPVSHILTTNYDNSLFKSIGGEKAIVSYDNSEKKYSIRRKYVIDNPSGGRQQYWPIHGTIDSPSSIMLGFDHYCGSLVKIESFVKGNDDYHGVRLESINKRLKNGITNPISWVDLFFTSNVHIIGLGLGYEEIDLWWVLNKRKRIKKAEPSLIKNKIYYYPVGALGCGLKRVFSSFDVVVVPVDSKLISEAEYMPRYETQVDAMIRNISRHSHF